MAVVLGLVASGVMMPTGRLGAGDAPAVARSAWDGPWSPSVGEAEVERFLGLWTPRVAGRTEFQAYLDAPEVPESIRAEGFHDLDVHTQAYLAHRLVERLEAVDGATWEPIRARGPETVLQAKNEAKLGFTQLIFHKDELVDRKPADAAPVRPSSSHEQAESPTEAAARAMASRTTTDELAEFGPPRTGESPTPAAPSSLQPEDLARRFTHLPAARADLLEGAAPTWKLCAEPAGVCSDAAAPGATVPLDVDGDLQPDAVGTLAILPHIDETLAPAVRTVLHLSRTAQQPLAQHVFAVADLPALGRRLSIGSDGRRSTISDHSVLLMIVRTTLEGDASHGELAGEVGALHGNEPSPDWSMTVAAGGREESAPAAGAAFDFGLAPGWGGSIAVRRGADGVTVGYDGPPARALHAVYVAPGQSARLDAVPAAAHLDVDLAVSRPAPRLSFAASETIAVHATVGLGSAEGVAAALDPRAAGIGRGLTVTDGVGPGGGYGRRARLVLDPAPDALEVDGGTGAVRVSSLRPSPHGLALWFDLDDSHTADGMGPASGWWLSQAGLPATGPVDITAGSLTGRFDAPAKTIAIDSYAIAHSGSGQPVDAGGMIAVVRSGDEYGRFVAPSVRGGLSARYALDDASATIEADTPAGLPELRPGIGRVKAACSMLSCPTFAPLFLWNLPNSVELSYGPGRAGSTTMPTMKATASDSGLRFIGVVLDHTLTNVKSVFASGAVGRQTSARIDEATGVLQLRSDPPIHGLYLSSPAEIADRSSHVRHCEPSCSSWFRIEVEISLDFRRFAMDRLTLEFLDVGSPFAAVDVEPGIAWAVDIPSGSSFGMTAHGIDADVSGSVGASVSLLGFSASLGTFSLDVLSGRITEDTLYRVSHWSSHVAWWADTGIIFCTLPEFWRSWHLRVTITPTPIHESWDPLSLTPTCSGDTCTYGSQRFRSAARGDRFPFFVFLNPGDRIPSLLVGVITSFRSTINGAIGLNLTCD